jgi:predicted Zn-dependent protease
MTPKMTMTKPWTIHQLKSDLSKRSAVKAWIVTEENVSRRERYFMLDGDALVTDQDREVASHNVHLKLFVDIAKAGRQGEISKKLFQAIPLSEQLDSAIASAIQTDHQEWRLPTELPREIPQTKTADPRMAEDLGGVMNHVTDSIARAVAVPRDTRFNSAELFLSVHDTELHLSNGLVHRSSQSRIYTEAAYSYARPNAQGKSESDEYLNARWTVTLDDLPIERIFTETSDRARHSLDTVKPVTGRYAVIIDADVLATLFQNQLSQLSSANSYHGLPFVKPGDELISGMTGKAGDLLTITLDPSLDHGADSTALSETGLIQKPFRLVEKNRVIATATDKRYADYLAAPATTVRGNIVVEPGSLSHAELTRQAPQVIEILQFSGLFADPNSGTFGSEIRLAKLYDNETGKVTYLKGGSLSGSFSENFRGALLSKNRVKRAHFNANSAQGEGYFGPEHALLSDVSIVG